MDDTQKDGSDSDWDSTLDFTSPRQVGVGQFPRHVANEAEIEEESSLSDESEEEAAPELPSDRQMIRNELKVQENVKGKSRSPSPARKENNLVLAQKQQNVQKGQQAKDQQQKPQQQMLQRKGNNQNEGPPYNFREAMTDQTAPEPAVRSPPGKDRKGMTYDPGPSPSPRGKQVPQGSIRSVGSWDDSDQDERTLRELRQNYRQEKQKEEKKLKDIEVSEAKSVLEEAPQTARSESTWRSWAGGKRGKKNKSANQNNEGATQNALTPTMARTSRPQASAVTMPTNAPRIEVVPAQETVTRPSVEVYEQRYQPAVLPAPQQVQSPSLTSTAYQVVAPSPGPYPVATPGPYPVAAPSSYPAPPITQYLVPSPRPAAAALDTEDVELVEEPKQLIFKDEDRGRFVYFFGQGNLQYLEVNEEYDEAVLPGVADRVDKIIKRVWKEVFAILRIILSIFIHFIVELFGFFAQHIFQRLILGIVVAMGDFVIKPLLSAIFNGFMQPISTFLWNTFTVLRHMFRPIGDILKRIFEQVAMLCRSIRLFEITWVSSQTLPQYQQVQQQQAKIHNI